MTSPAPARVVSIEAEDAMIIARITEHGKLGGLIRQRNYKIARKKNVRFPTILWTTWNEKEGTSGKRRRFNDLGHFVVHFGMRHWFSYRCNDDGIEG